MKLKSIVSKTLVMGLLFNNGLTSLAGVLSDDGRYETYEGTSITIDNILEEDKVDVEVEGNTLVSPMKNVSYSGYSKVAMKKMEDGRIVNDSTSGVSSNNNYYMMDTDSKEYLRLKKGTTYTIFISGIIDFDESNLNRFVVPFYRNLNDGVPVTRAIETINVSQGAYFDETIVFTTNNQDMESFGFYISNASSIVNSVDMYFHVVEGNLSNEKISYFEGMKSVGQDNTNSHGLEVLSSRSNEFKETDGIVLPTGLTNTFSNGIYTKNIGKIVIDGNTNLTPHPIEGSVITYRYCLYLPNLKESDIQNSLGDTLPYLFDDSDSIHYKLGRAPSTIFLYIPMEYKDRPNDYFKENPFTLYYEYITPIIYQVDAIEIPLIEPLRALPNGVRDRIIKRNGQWVIERNCGEILTEMLYNASWKLHRKDDNAMDHFAAVFENINGKIAQGINLYSNTMASGYWGSETPYTICTSSTVEFQIGINLEKGTYTEDKLKEYIKTNKMRVIYELETPIYEPLGIDSSVNIYADTTYISTNSAIPANIKITVDRTINRAVEAIELAKTNPTVENLSKARMWINLLDESIKKDGLQNEINNITDLDDMVLERKTATANLDVYIMCENMLSMSLNTNNITFDNYSGVEDMEKPNALEISINSSLPYDLNAYLQTEIKGSENSNIMDIDILKIKDSGKDNYQSFSNITDKVILNEDCSSGNYISHNIDLKLESSNAYSVDVYKTTIKFEAVQK